MVKVVTILNRVVRVGFNDSVTVEPELRGD